MNVSSVVIPEAQKRMTVDNWHLNLHISTIWGEIGLICNVNDHFPA